MRYRIVFQPEARDDLRQAWHWAAEYAPDTAARWLNRFEEAIQTLREYPQRCGLATENRFVDDEIRELHYGRRIGTFRVLFTIRDDKVHVLRIVRAARDSLSPHDLSPPSP